MLKRPKVIQTNCLLTKKNLSLKVRVASATEASKTIATPNPTNKRTAIKSSLSIPPRIEFLSTLYECQPQSKDRQHNASKPCSHDNFWFLPTDGQQCMMKWSQRQNWPF